MNAKMRRQMNTSRQILNRRSRPLCSCRYGKKGITLDTACPIHGDPTARPVNQDETTLSAEAVDAANDHDVERLRDK